MARLTRSSSHQHTSIDTDDLSQPDSQPPSPVRSRKYALVQHLPTGDWWTSVSSEPPTTEENSKPLKAYHTANADLVAVFPSPSGSDFAYKGTLGDYARKRPQSAAPYRAPAPRRVSCGKFLDYGPYASFAPSFDQDGVEVGRVAMGELVFYQTMRRRLRSLAKGKRRTFLATNDCPAPTTEDTPQDVDMEDASAETSTATVSKENKTAALVDGIESLLPPEEVSSIKASLGSLELEQAVEDLLQRNARALVRLEELQMDRLRSQRGAASAVQVDSEEWQVAQGITDSLAVLASLRPRPSNGDSAPSPLIPPSSVLHKLQRTLPLSPTEGWYGSLPDGRTTAFHDNTTLHVRPGSSKPVTVPIPAAPTPARATATPTPKPTTPAPTAAYTPYSAYTTAYPTTAYRATGYTPYPTTAQSTYYPSAYGAAATPAAAVPAGAAAASTHYPNAKYSTAAGQGQNSYYNWYNTAGAGAGGQPQPPSQPQAQTQTQTQAHPSQTGMSGNFASYFAAGAAPAQRAVANTVTLKQPYPSSTAAAGGGTAGWTTPTLPPLLRSAAGTPTPTPSVAATAAAEYGGGGTYYGGYSAPR